MARFLETALLSPRKVLVIEDQLTSARPHTYVLEIFEDSAFCRHSTVCMITMRLNRDEGVKELLGYESDRRRNLLICTNCLRKSFVLLLRQHQWNASSVQVY